MDLLRRGVVAALALHAASWARAGGVDVRLRESAPKAYDIEGAFLVEASSNVVWGVLEDYDHIGGFVSTIRLSRVKERRSDGAALVEQEAVGGVGFLSRRVHVLLEVKREAGELRFEDVGKKDFQRYEGAWEVLPAPQGMEVRYRLRAALGFLAPRFLLRRSFKGGARGLLDQVRSEIVRRAGRLCGAAGSRPGACEPGFLSGIGLAHSSPVE